MTRIGSIVKQGNRELLFDVDETPKGLTIRSTAYYVDGVKIQNPSLAEIFDLRVLAIKKVIEVYSPHKSYSLSNERSSGMN